MVSQRQWEIFFYIIIGISIAAVILYRILYVLPLTHCDPQYEVYQTYDLSYYNYTCGQVGFMIKEHAIYPQDLPRKTQDLVYQCPLFDHAVEMNRVWEHEDIMNWYALNCQEDICGITFSRFLTPEMEEQWVRSCVE